MSKISIKKLIQATLLCGVILTGQALLPIAASAATDQEVQAAAQAGVQYLSNHQNADGSITGLGGESDWTAVAVKAAGTDVSDLSKAGTSLTDFLEADMPPAGAPATAIERKMFAVVAADGDTSNFGGTNYTNLLANQHVSNQVGDPTLLNDDIFGVIAIQASGKTSLKSAAQDGLDYFISHQNADGGFSYTTESCMYCGSDSNDTAAAIIAMYAGDKLGLIMSSPDAKANALIYLLSTQQADGGFGYDIYSPSDGSSTAWSLMALNVIGSPVATQAAQARDWLLKNQNPDGGFSFGAYGINTSDTFTTAHAITALLGSTWLLSPEPLSVPASEEPNSTPQVTGSTSSQSNTSQTTTASVNTTSSSGSNQSSVPNEPADLTVETALPDVGKNALKVDEKTTEVAAISGIKSGAKYAAVAALGLVGVGWFVLESRKAKGVN